MCYIITMETQQTVNNDVLLFIALFLATFATELIRTNFWYGVVAILLTAGLVFLRTYLKIGNK